MDKSYLKLMELWLIGKLHRKPVGDGELYGPDNDILISCLELGGEI